MTRLVDLEEPDRLYTVTGGRAYVGEDTFDLVTLIVSESDPAPGMQSEYASILRMCHYPMAVVEISAGLGLPVSVVRILLGDLRDAGSISVCQPSTPLAPALPPDREILKQVLVGLRKL